MGFVTPQVNTSFFFAGCVNFNKRAPISWKRIPLRQRQSRKRGAWTLLETLGQKTFGIGWRIRYQNLYQRMAKRKLSNRLIEQENGKQQRRDGFRDNQGWRKIVRRPRLTTDATMWCIGTILISFVFLNMIIWWWKWTKRNVSPQFLYNYVKYTQIVIQVLTKVSQTRM